MDYECKADRAVVAVLALECEDLWPDGLTMRLWDLWCDLVMLDRAPAKLIRQHLGMLPRGPILELSWLLCCGANLIAMIDCEQPEEPRLIVGAIARSPFEADWPRPDGSTARASAAFTGASQWPVSHEWLEGIALESLIGLESHTPRPGWVYPRNQWRMEHERHKLDDLVASISGHGITFGTKGGADVS